MITVEWPDLDSYSENKPNFAEQEELRISGVVAMRFMPDEKLPSTIAAVVDKLHYQAIVGFGAANVTGVQSPAQQHPEYAEVRHVAFIHAEYEGERIADLTFISKQRKRQSGSEVTLTKGVSDLSMILPLGDHTDASKQIVVAAWPHFAHLYCYDGSADHLYVVRAKGDDIVASGYDAVLRKGLDLNLPKKTIFLLETL